VAEIAKVAKGEKMKREESDTRLGEAPVWAKNHASKLFVLPLHNTIRLDSPFSCTELSTIAQSRPSRVTVPAARITGWRYRGMLKTEAQKSANVGGAHAYETAPQICNRPWSVGCCTILHIGLRSALWSGWSTPAM